MPFVSNTQTSASTEIVAVDIGGTHARFAIARPGDNGRIELENLVTLQTEDHSSFQTAWQEYRGHMGGILPRSVAMAIAGPVDGNVIRLTNNPWVIQPAMLQETLEVDQFTIINDFGAVAHTVACSSCDHFVHLAGPDIKLPEVGTISVVGPGTGLGVAYLWRDESGSYRVQATEGGHGDFSPLDQIEDAILNRLRERHGRVSVERVVSGPAIVDVYATLAKLEGKAITELSDREIWQAGTSGGDEIAAAAVDRFCLALGAVAGDYALAHGASGVVIAGGLGYRIRDTLLRSGFAERFCAKGRYEHMMAGLPVKLITHEQPGLCGAAVAFFREHGG